MAESRKGHCLALSPARKMVLEFLHHGQKAPSLPLSKVMRVGALMDARKAGAAASWTSIFMKAYGLVAQQHPELRRAYIPFPWGHYYEHPISECVVLLERDVDGENATLGGKVREPEAQPLGQIDADVTRLRTAPIDEICEFRQWLRLGRMPWLIRRILFWIGLNFSGYKRAKKFGTFAISSLGNLGVEQYHPISPLTTYLTFGPIAPSGEVTVKIIYDHRVMDGRCVARALNDLEEVLNTQILGELNALAKTTGPASIPIQKIPA